MRPARSDAEPVAGLMGSTALIMATGTAPLMVLSVLGPGIIDDLGLSPGQYGRLSATIFAIAAPMSVVFGAALAKRGARPYVAVSSVLAAVACGLLATAHSGAMLIAFCAVTAVAIGIGNPLTNVLIARSTVRSKGQVMGFKQSGVQFSQFAIGLIAPLLAVVLGWRGATFALGGMVLLAGLATRISIRSTLDRSDGVGPTVGGRTGRSADIRLQIYRRPLDVLPLALHTLIFGVIVQSTHAFLPLYGYREFSLSLEGVGFLVALVGAAGIVGRLLVGYFADRLQPRDLYRLLIGSAVGSALAMTVFSLSAGQGTVMLAGGAVLYALATLSGNVVTMLIVTTQSRPSAVARNSGIVAAALSTGFCLGPFVLGSMLESGIAFPDVWWVFAVAAGVATVVIERQRRVFGRLTDGPMMTEREDLGDG